MKIPFDADAINATIQRALASAGLDTRSGPLHGVTETIRRALAGGRPAESGPAAAAGATSTDAGKTFGDDVVDVTARVVTSADEKPGARPASAGSGPAAPGRFESHPFSNEAGTRRYKLYLPANPAPTQRAMIVMLHGCTQSADDFAAGTQMNRLADRHGFLVLYPEQNAQANASKCWNWFQPQDQHRGAGEPALLAGMTRDIAQRHGVDPQRIFVAGLSAGAAMALVLGETYPELYAGVGAHSGLPYASAHDIPSALAAMKDGRSGVPGPNGRTGGAALPLDAAMPAVPVVPTIVFHGDRDHTVQAANGQRIVQRAQQAHGGRAAGTELRVSTEAGVAAGGRRFSRTIHSDADGRALIEQWTVHGAGHAWSGGDTAGSYTDDGGPDASAAMVRFFLALSPVATS